MAESVGVENQRIGSVTGQAKALLRRQEWLRRAAHKLSLRTQGRWLYTRDVLGWVAASEHRAQLPLLYRLFSRYCAGWMAVVPTHAVIGARAMLYVVMRLQRRVEPCSSFPLSLNGQRVYLDLHDARFLAAANEILAGDIHRLLAAHLSPGDTFVDVGANQGAFSIIAAQLVGSAGRVVSIEPQPQLAHNIERSLQTATSCRAEVHQRAVGDVPGSVELIVPRSYSGTAGLYRAHSGLDRHDMLKVDMVVFDEAVDWRTFAGSVFVKLDIEGAELRFLRGARSMLTALKPTLMMEINPASLDAAGERREDLLELLTAVGYARYRSLDDLAVSRPLATLDTSRFQNVILSA